MASTSRARSTHCPRRRPGRRGRPGRALPLKFFRDNDGQALVEPRTGAIVDLMSSEEAITATLDLAPLDELRDALGREPASPRSPPSPMHWTPSSEQRRPRVLAPVRTDGGVRRRGHRRTKTDLRKLDLVERLVPVGLGALSAVLLVLVGVEPMVGRSSEEPRPAAVAAGPPCLRARAPRPAGGAGQPRPAKRLLVGRALGDQELERAAAHAALPPPVGALEREQQRPQPAVAVETSPCPPGRSAG